MSVPHSLNTCIPNFIQTADTPGPPPHHHNYCCLLPSSPCHGFPPHLVMASLLTLAPTSELLRARQAGKKYSKVTSKQTNGLTWGTPCSSSRSLRALPSTHLYSGAAAPSLVLNDPAFSTKLRLSTHGSCSSQKN